MTIGLAPRDFPPTISQQDRQRVMPNFVAKQGGRDCLLFGALDGFEMADALIMALGGTPIVKRLSRGDLCLDVVNLDVQELLRLAQAGHFVTRASIVEPKRNLVTDEVNGFYAGKFPQYMTVYDKPREQRGKTERPKGDAALHGRCKSAGAKGRGPSSRGTGRVGKASQNPKDSKGFGNGCRQAASPVKAEGMGIESSADFDVTDSSVCDCENCQQCRAANALHFECVKSQFLASLDIDLQRLIERWDRLDESARQAFAAYDRDLVEAVT